MVAYIPKWLIALVGVVLLGSIAGVVAVVTDPGWNNGTTTTVVREIPVGTTGSSGAESSSAPDAAADTGTGAGPSPAPGSCDAEGINRAVGNEGTCKEGGIEYVVVNRDTPLQLDTLTAELLSIEMTDTLDRGYGRPLNARGTFAVITLRVTNTGTRPDEFDSINDQTILRLGNSTFTEDSRASPPGSFADRVATIQPQQTLTGTVIYDLEDQFLDDLDQNGNLGIVNFGDYVDLGKPKQLGLIRTYAP